MDANANVEQKNIATLETELYKRDAICVNRLAMYAKLKALYGTDLAEEVSSPIGGARDLPP